MIALDSPLWSELSHAYGKASEVCSAPLSWTAASGFGNYRATLDIPGLLKRLEAEPQVVSDDWEAEPWYSLWSALCHQGDVYTASYAAVPHLVRIAFTVEGIPDWQFFGMPVCIEIARARQRGPVLPQEMSESYFIALQRLHNLAHKIAQFKWDEGLSRVIAATLVVTHGHVELGETILNLSPEAIKKLRVHQGLD